MKKKVKSEQIGYSCIDLENAHYILKDELMKHDELYNGWLKSIETGILDAPNYINPHALAEKILNRIIGED